jgi:3-hydroxybutyryl-CoA dehydrogenase
MTMPLDPNRKDLIVGVAGAGAMGRGIAQVAATSGIAVKLFDARRETALEAKDFIASMLSRAVEKGKMTKALADDAVGRIAIVDSYSAFAPCHVVIEAVVENLDVKRKVFAELECIVAEDALLASNTSSLSVTTIATACKRPERVAGFHFFNPVPVMLLVEVIDGINTASWVADVLMGLGKRMGREPVRVKDAPGFLVNQVGRGFTIEAAHAAAEGVAAFADIDRVMRETASFRMGPFELMDLTALDVTQPATEMIYGQYYHEPRYRPSPLMAQRLEAQLLGRKTERGFYAYKDNKQIVPDEAPAPAYDGRPVWISRVEPERHGRLMDIVRAAGAPIDEGGRPGKDSLIFVTPLGDDATTAALDQGLDPERALAVDTLFDMVKRRVIMKTPVTEPAFVASAHGLFATGGVPVTILRDSPGFIAQRIVAMIVNIGCAIAQAGIASPSDIDKAVSLGLGYPHGPLAFGDALGPAKVLRIVESMHARYRDPRYRPALWLQRRARLGVSLLTPES